MTPSERLKETIRQYLEIGSPPPVAPPPRRSARRELESVLRELLGGTASSRERVEDLLEEIAARSRRGAEQLTDYVLAEVRKELAARAARRRDEMLRALAARGRSDLADLADRVGSLIGDVLGERRSTPGRSSSSSTEPTGVAGRDRGANRVDDRLDVPGPVEATEGSAPAIPESVSHHSASTTPAPAPRQRRVGSPATAGRVQSSAKTAAARTRGQADKSGTPAPAATAGRARASGPSRAVTAKSTGAAPSVRSATPAGASAATRSTAATKRAGAARAQGGASRRKGGPASASDDAGPAVTARPSRPARPAS